MKVNELIRELNRKPLDADVDMFELLKIVLDSQPDDLGTLFNWGSVEYQEQGVDNNIIIIVGDKVGFAFCDNNTKLAGVYNWKD